MRTRHWLICLAAAVFAVGRTATPLWAGDDPAAEGDLAAVKAEGKSGAEGKSRGKSPLHVLKGRVLAKGSGKPLSDFIVAVVEAGQGHIAWQGGRHVQTEAPDQTALLFFTKRNGRRCGRATTDDQGVFKIRSLKYGTYHVVIVQPNAAATILDDIEYNEGDDSFDFVIEPQDAVEDCVVEGRVLDADGEPVGNAQAAIVDVENGVVHWSSGEDGFGRVIRRLIVETQTELDGSQPGWFYDHSNSRRTASVVCDAEGRFKFEFIPAGAYNLAVADTEKGVALVENLKVHGKTEPLELRLESKAGDEEAFAISGTTVDADGKPVVGAIVAVVPVEGGRVYVDDSCGLHPLIDGKPAADAHWFREGLSNHGRLKVLTDEDGAFTVEALPAGKYHLAAIDASTSVALVENIEVGKDAKPISLALKLKRNEPSYEFKGRILDADGKPVERAAVALTVVEKGYIYNEYDAGFYVRAPGSREEGRPFAWLQYSVSFGRYGNAATSSDGSFTISNIKAGKYNLVAKHSEKGWLVASEVEFDDKAAPQDYRLTPSVYIEGSVNGLTDDQRRKGLYAAIKAEGFPDGVALGAGIDIEKDNKFRVGPLPEAKKWKLLVFTNVPEQGYWAPLVKRSVSVEAGKTAKLDVDVTGGREISGVVRGPKGKPLSGVSVSAVTVEDEDNAIGGVTDKDGKYTIRGLSEGNYKLVGVRHVPRTAPG